MAVTRQKHATRSVCELSIFVLSLLQAAGITSLGVYGAACSAGRFEDASNPGSCFDCPANTYSTTSGAIGNSTCLSCGKDLSGLVDLASLPGKQLSLHAWGRRMCANERMCTQEVHRISTARARRAISAGNRAYASLVP